MAYGDDEILQQILDQQFAGQAPGMDVYGGKSGRGGMGGAPKNPNDRLQLDQRPQIVAQDYPEDVEARHRMDQYGPNKTMLPGGQYVDVPDDIVDEPDGLGDALDEVGARVLGGDYMDKETYNAFLASPQGKMVQDMWNSGSGSVQQTEALFRDWQAKQELQLPPQ